MKKLNDKEIKQKTIFVDCFNTIILRNTKNNIIFKKWAQGLSIKFNIPWKTLYKKYKSINLKLCFYKIFTKFILQENFDIILRKMHCKLVKKYKDLDLEEFVTYAKNIYIEKEKETHTTDKTFIELLRRLKNDGAKIYVVSDFYCQSSIIKKWLNNLEIDDIFEEVFSSCDFDKEKSTAGLYKYLKKYLNIDGSDILMIGDNIWSDVFMAKLCGLNSQKINHTKEK